MATLSDWSAEVPANTSVVSQFDDTYRSDKSNERNAWEEEHFWDSGSSVSAGYHREGSLRPFRGPFSEVSQSGLPGQRLMWTSDTSELYDASHGSTPVLLSRFAPAIWHPLLGSLDTTVGAVTLGSARAGVLRATVAGAVHADRLMVPTASYNTTRAFTAGGVATTIHWMDDSATGKKSTGRVIDVTDPPTADIELPSVGTNFRLSLYTYPHSNIT